MKTGSNGRLPTTGFPVRFDRKNAAMSDLMLAPKFWIAIVLAGLALTVAAVACRAEKLPMPPVAHVDIDRYMGSWYVIAAIPTPPERNAYNAVESYSLRPDGKIETSFRYREGGFDGKVKTMHPVGIVQPDSGNAIWGMRFVWPIEAEYVITYLESDYSAVVVGRSKRDYVWIMARTPTLPDDKYQELVKYVGALGYDAGKLRKTPQRWPEDSIAPPSM